MFDDVSSVPVPTLSQDTVENISRFGWQLNREHNRIIISQDGLFRCFIGKAYDIRESKYVVSAHMVVYDKSLNLNKLQFWNPSSSDDDNTVCNKIIKDLTNLHTFCTFM